MKQLIYADNAATTKLDIDAFEAMKPYLLDKYGNPSQPYSFSRFPKHAIKEARRIIAECINASPEEIYFTSGGTESDNWVISKFAYGDLRHIITTQIEHHAILNSCKHEEQGINNRTDIKYTPVDENGLVNIEEIIKVLTEEREAVASCESTLISVMFANNEIGTIQPIKEISRIAHENGASFHTDAVQAVGHVKIDVKELGVDFLSASAHKFNGPKGIGFLYIKKGGIISPYHYGGAQESGMRAGTENVAAIVGMAVALKNNIDNLESNENHVKRLERHLIEKLNSSSLDYKRNGTNQLPGNISLSFKDADGEALLHRLDLLGICVSTGSACDSVNTQISHVLKAIQLDEEYAKGTIRISLSKDNTTQEIDEIISALERILK